MGRFDIDRLVRRVAWFVVGVIAVTVIFGPNIIRFLNALFAK